MRGQRGAGGRRVPRSRAAAMAALLLGLLPHAGCTTIGTDPAEAASIELEPFPFPAVVIGDTLRDSAGVVAPVRAIVRNVQGDPIPDYPVTYLYADVARDSALAIDASTGVVRALRAATAEARIAARAGAVLQVLRALVVTPRPDTLARGGAVPPLLTTTLPDTGRSAATANTTAALEVAARSLATGTPAAVRGWLVRYTLLAPANPSNDTTAAAFLVNDAGRASTLDTTDAAGTAGRKVRVRAAAFPTGAAVDSVIVRADASYRGVPLRGSPVRLAVPVRRGGG